MAIDDRFTSELKDRLQVSDVVGHSVRLTKAGRELKGCCPFHNEKTASFYVNDDKGMFHCFGCGAHGDVIGFTMRHKNLDFVEAVEVLAGMAGMEVPKATPEEKKRYDHENRLYKLVEKAAQWFQMQLKAPAGKQAMDYFKSRGLDASAIQQFGLGYAPAKGQLLRDYLMGQGYTDKEMIEAGLLRRPEPDARRTDMTPYSFFRNRVMFPISDRRGRIVAFGGRLMEGDGPKYINTSATTLFRKGEVLYGMGPAREAASAGQPIVVVEGYMDVISMVRAGFRGAVAPNGTALTESQIQEIWRMLPAGTPADQAPILCFDGDSAGRKAAYRAAERILPHLGPDRTVKIAFMDGGDDPDSLIRNAGSLERGAELMAAVLQGAKPFSDVLWEMETEGRRFDTPEARAGLKANLSRRVSAITNADVQALYRSDMEARFRQAFSWAPNARDRIVPALADGGAGGLPHPQPPARRIQRPSSEIGDRVAAAALLNHPWISSRSHHDPHRLNFGPTDLERLRCAALRQIDQATGIDRIALRVHLEGLGFGRVLEDVLSGATYIHAAFAAPTAGPDEVLAGWDAHFTARRAESPWTDGPRPASHAAAPTRPNPHESQSPQTGVEAPGATPPHSSIW